MTHHETNRIPAKWLIGASGVVVAAAAVLWAALLGDGGHLNAHGNSGLILVLVFPIFVGGAIVELVALAISLRWMVRAPELRTRRNMTASLIGTIPIIALCWLMWPR